LNWRLAKIGFQRSEQSGLVIIQRRPKLFKLSATECQLPRCSGLKVTAMTLNAGSKIHNQIVKSSPAISYFVKR
jgi:hypothetical protein